MLPLLCIAWSDGTALTTRMSAHPVSLKIGNVSPEAFQKRVRERWDGSAWAGLLAAWRGLGLREVLDV